MPIHFRCAFCNQLLGIARRKSGSVINCPTCGGPLVVPRMPDGEEKSATGKPPANRLLEECDFDVILKPPEPAQAVSASVLGTTPGSAVPQPASSPHKSGGSSPASAMTHSGNGSGVTTPAKVVTKPAGLVLSTTVITILAVALVLFLAAAFVAGFLVGRAVS
jgi:hypothetical protein